MPIDFAQLSAVIGPTAAVFVVMYLNRKPDAEKKTADPLAVVIDRLDKIEVELRAGFAAQSDKLSQLIGRSDK